MSDLILETSLRDRVLENPVPTFGMSDLISEEPLLITTKYDNDSQKRFPLPKIEGELLWNLGTVSPCSVVKRPSALIKSPYVADVVVQHEQPLGNGAVQAELAHTPSLGCCGYVEAGQTCLVTAKTGTKTKTRYSIDFAVQNGTVVCVNPLYGNYLSKLLLEQNRLPHFPPFQHLKPEFTYGESRFDFYGQSNGRDYFIEVKSVPLAYYLSPTTQSDLNNNPKPLDLNDTPTNRYRNKRALFPHGYRKRASDPVSPRALKHIQHLEEIKVSNPSKNECVLLFLVNRDDCNCLEIAQTDPIYHAAVKSAASKGVEILACEIIWQRDLITKNMSAYLGRMLPVIL